MAGSREGREAADARPAVLQTTSLCVLATGYTESVSVGLLWNLCDSSWLVQRARADPQGAECREGTVSWPGWACWYTDDAPLSVTLKRPLPTGPPKVCPGR